MNKPLFLHLAVQDQVLFAKRLSMMLRSGIPIMESLRMLQQESRTGSATYIYHTIAEDVSVGHSLSSSLRKFEYIFGEFCINIVKVGEKSGTLHINLGHIADELRRRQGLRRKVVGALVYPAVIVVATTLITLMLTVYIFPKIVPVFQSVKATLPLSTRMLMSISAYLSQWGMWLFFIVIGLGITCSYVHRSFYMFHKCMDHLLLRAPIFGKLSQYYNLATITRVMGILLKSDVQITEAFELAAGSTRNLVYRESLLRARDAVTKGQTISAQFKNNKLLYPPVLAQMLSVGETTGNLAGTFAFLSEMYEEDVDALTKNLTTLLEPILMVVMGVVVGFIAISIIAPIYSITQNLQPH